jgi:hypothetical protein
MLIEGSTLKVGGRPFKYWLGTKITQFGINMTSKNKYRLVTNPQCKLFNPFTLVVSFTVDGNEKYQVALQGDYKKIYKETSDNDPELLEREMFAIIYENRGEWFKKE